MEQLPQQLSMQVSYSRDHVLFMAASATIVHLQVRNFNRCMQSVQHCFYAQQSVPKDKLSAYVMMQSATTSVAPPAPSPAFPGAAPCASRYCHPAAAGPEPGHTLVDRDQVCRVQDLRCMQHMTDWAMFLLQSAATHMCTRLAPLAVIILLQLPLMWRGPLLRGLTPQAPMGPTQGQLWSSALWLLSFNGDRRLPDMLLPMR